MLIKLFYRRRQYALGLLLGLTLNLALPAGYMLDFSRSLAQGLPVVFCGGLQLPAESREHQHHDAGQHPAASAQAEICPYFVAGGLSLAVSTVAGSRHEAGPVLQELDVPRWWPSQTLNYSMVPRAPPTLVRT